MADDFTPSGQVGGIQRQTGHVRILAFTGLVGLAGLALGIIFVSVRFGIGFLIGSALAFANYFWLKRSLRQIFRAVEDGQRPRMLGLNYFLRYLVLGLFIAVVYASDVVPIASLLLGMAGIGFAIILEGSVRMFSHFNQKET